MDGGSMCCTFFIAVSLTIAHFSNGNNIYVIEGEKQVIQWTVSPAPGNIYVRILNPSDETLYSALGKATIPGTGPNSDRVTNTGNTNTNTGHIEFTLNSVRVTDAGDYKAKYDPGSGSVRPVGTTLIIYVRPSKPVLTIVTSPVVGQDMVLQCKASSNSKPDGQLTTKYKWYLNGTDLPPTSRYVASGTQLQVNNIQKSDKHSKLTCRGFENPVLLSDVSNGYTPDVKYGPNVVNVSPTTDSHTVDEKSTVGPIICTADCNPSCTYQWKFNGTNVSGQSNTLTINNIQRSDAGVYWCSAFNSYGARDSSNISITVQYGPKAVKLSPSATSYTLVEVTQNTLGPITCSADCNPACNYQWWQNGTVIGISAVLKLSDATRVDSAMYTCNASNKYGNKESASVSVDVQYRPENVKLIPTKYSYELLKNDRLGPISCSATCNPACTYKWRRDQADFVQGDVLDIPKMDSTQTGSFTCVSANKHGFIESNRITVVLGYPPDIVNITTNIPDNSIQENSTLSLICSTNSVPSSDVVIWLQGKTQRIVYRSSDVLEVNFTKSTECLDTGTYFCSAANKYGNSTSKDIEINVICSPRPIIGTKTEISISIGSKESLVIKGTVVAYPRPNISWTFRRRGDNTVIDIVNAIDDVEIYILSNHVTHSSLLVKSKTGTLDLGDYIMNASNPYGSVSLIYHVTNKQSEDNCPESQEQDCFMFSAGIAMIVIGVTCLGLGLVLTIYSVRRIGCHGNMHAKSQRSKDSTGNTFERDNAAYSELDIPRSNVYEDLGEKDKPSLYDRFKTNKQEPDKVEYANTKRK